MTRPQIKQEISLGSIVSTAAMLVAIGVAFGALRAQNEQTMAEVERVDQTLQAEQDARRSIDAAHASRLRQVENSQARTDERFVQVLSALERIDRRLNEALNSR